MEKQMSKGFVSGLQSRTAERILEGICQSGTNEKRRLIAASSSTNRCGRLISHHHTHSHRVGGVPTRQLIYNKIFRISSFFVKKVIFFNTGA
jgi:hypothetical protein